MSTSNGTIHVPQTVSAAHHAAALIDEAGDLAGFLAQVGAELPPDLAREAAGVLERCRAELLELTDRIEAAGPID